MKHQNPVGIISQRWLRQRWQAHWCRHPDADVRYRSGVFLFRRTLTLDADSLSDGATFVVHMSADQRYRLFVNGVSVLWGPARGDVRHWRFETVDLAPFLRVGDNVLAAHVHYFEPDLMPQAQTSVEAAFLMQGESEAEAIVNTPGAWKICRDDAYRFDRRDADALHTYCVVGPSEYMDLAQHPAGWQSAEFDDSGWLAPVAIGRAAAPFGLSDAESRWWLVPREIPAMEETPQPFGRVVRAEGVTIASIPDGWPATSDILTIPPHTKVVLLFDHGAETCAFPEIDADGGAGATLGLAYAESLVSGGSAQVYEMEKGHRDDVSPGRVLRGYADHWTLDGGTHTLRPLWWKTFRYAELTVETADEPLRLLALRSVYTGYPFEERAQFHAPELPDAGQLWDIGWRTARLCAHESFMDCPYYEQLQYIGDTRIQCLVSLYTSGDPRLFRNALAQIDASRLPEGLTLSRFPANTAQVIPPFSLWYIGMIADYARHVPNDDAFIHSLLPGVRGILDWFHDHLRSDGLLGPLPFWNFVDWASEWSGGVPPGAREGGSAVLTLQYAIACGEAASLFAFIRAIDGPPTESEMRQTSSFVVPWTIEAVDAAFAVRKLCFDEESFRVADTPEKTPFSQHAAILAILADAIPPEQFRPVMERVLADADMTQATFYFRFYLNRALVKAGMGDLYLDTLGPWQDMRAMGLTTWAEKPEPTRSDCHAWSSAPNFEFLATVLGIQPTTIHIPELKTILNRTDDQLSCQTYRGTFPDGIGWSGIRIAPHLGALTEASGVVPHPDGEIRVAYRRDGDRLEADITLPEWSFADEGSEEKEPNDWGRGWLYWRGQAIPLHCGQQTVTITAPDYLAAPGDQPNS